MKLAVSTDDKKTVCKNYFQASRNYFIFEILNDEIVSEELRENPYSDINKNGQTDRILYLLKDCSLFLGERMQEKSLAKIASKNIDVIITTIENVDKAISSYLESVDKYFQYYDLKSEKLLSKWMNEKSSSLTRELDR